RSPTLDDGRARFAADLDGLPPAARRVRAPVAPRATVSGRLAALAADVRRRIEERMSAAGPRPPHAGPTARGPLRPAAHRPVSR
ncbi:hypothetical protein ACN6LA_007792, partial [Streptomyces sp. SAS_269]